MAAALLVPPDIASTTKSVRGLVPRGQRRTHFSNEGEKERRQIIDTFCQLPINVVIAISAYRGGDDQVARNACIRGLLDTFPRLGVAVAVFDTRDEDRDRADRIEIAAALEAGVGPADLHYTHRGSRDEPLLGLPDAFAWCHGAGGQWKTKIKPKVVRTVKV
jgi:hypothetical protein